MREVSVAALQAMMSQDTAEVFIACLKLEHPSFANPVRLAYNTEPLVRADGTYMPYAFQINLPDQQEDSIPQVKVSIDNTDLMVNNAIREIAGAPTVTMDVVLASSPDTSEAGPFEYSLTDITGDAGTITATLGYEDDVFAQQVPGMEYLPTNSPGMFA